MTDIQFTYLTEAFHAFAAVSVFALGYLAGISK